MRDNSGGRSLVLIVVFSIFCIFTYSSNLQHYLISSPSKRLFQNTSTAGRNKTLEVNNTDSARNYKTLNLYSFEKTSSNNISLETPWTTINESSLGLHLFSDNIENIRLIGERHSGTTFLVRHLKRCFPGRSVGDFFVAKKHWMQASPEKIISAAKKYGERGLAPTVLENDYDAKTWWQIANAPNPKSVFRASLLLVVFRDPYDWVEAMRKKPWHWPNHVDVRPRNSSVLKSTNYRKQQERGASGRRLRATIYDTPTGESVGGKLPATGSALTFQKEFIKHSLLGWKDFVTRPMHLLDYQEADDKERLCQKGFSFGTISPCHRNKSYVPIGVKQIPRAFLKFLPFMINDVVYELAGDGRPYDHPLQLRSAKIKNFLGLVQQWELGGFGLFRFDDILGNGLPGFIREISRALGAESQCPDVPPFEKARHDLPPEFREWVTNHGDWETERLVGFNQDGKE